MSPSPLAVLQLLLSMAPRALDLDARELTALTRQQQVALVYALLLQFGFDNAATFVASLADSKVCFDITLSLLVLFNFLHLACFVLFALS